MEKHTISLASLMLCGLLVTQSGAFAAEEQAVAAPGKQSGSAASQPTKSPKKEGASETAKPATQQPESLKVCDPESDVNTLEDLLRATAVAAILEKREDPASGTPVVWRRAD